MAQLIRPAHCCRLPTRAQYVRNLNRPSIPYAPATRRKLSSTARHGEQQQQQQQQHHQHYQEPFRTRLRKALRNTKVEWRPIPVGLGIGFLGALHFYRVRRRERQKEEEQLRLAKENGDAGDGGPGKRKRKRRIRPSGPWFVEYVHIDICIVGGQS